MIGEQIARLRSAAHLTQDQLAERAGISVDVIRRLEQGVRHSARLNTLTKIATALGAELSVIIAPRTTFAPEPDRGIPAIREAITSSTVDQLGGLAESDADIDLTRLATSVDSAWHIWQRGEYSILGRLLPDLIAEARHASKESTGADQEHAYSLLATVFELAAGVTVMLGHEDLAWLSTERAVAASEHCADEVTKASAVYWAAWILRRQGRFRESLTAATRAAETHEPRMTRATPAQLTVWGGLLINAAGAAARDDRAGTATDLLAFARTAAVRLGQDRVDRWSVFGPRLVAQSAVINATELGDFDTAVRLSAEVEATRSRVPVTWESRYLLALAQAQVELGQDIPATETLHKTRRLTPEWIRYHRLARDLTAELTTRIPAGRKPELDELSRHLLMT
ncbi:helix-turn-helix transcriptional regulator [Micromonospora fiedleri]|uniref:Helix-turn-helix transcriptional regulator n=1 Tax=Micromonospora fiedleri TaxID=1157498 RepID=A0ABS1UWW8_9ACTN|nr:helix-turn-helix domain-containing protein [Micromonospora fiedleri]MBL6280163.1 helix-turn-helix transcriptional regulator [Micromonospora fiedleri]